jgi:hypothetical protein
LVADRAEWFRRVETRFSHGVEIDKHLGRQNTPPPAPAPPPPPARGQDHLCTQCQQHFPNALALSTHLQLKHHQGAGDTAEGRYSCRRGCTANFATPQARGNHEATCQGDALSSQLAYADRRNAAARAKAKGKALAKAGALGQVVCPTCGVSMSRSGMTSHMRMHARREAAQQGGPPAPAVPAPAGPAPPHAPPAPLVARQTRVTPAGVTMYLCRQGCGKESAKAGSLARHEQACLGSDAANEQRAREQRRAWRQ